MKLNRRHLTAACLVLLLSACGGGGGGGSSTPPPRGNSDGLDDPTFYSSAANASLSGAEEAASVTAQSITIGGQRLDYTATAGHLIAREPAGAQRAEASMFYVAYTLPNANAATRPVTFFYNGGPGSASVWLQLGSFGPKRLVSGVPNTSGTQPFPMVDNAEHLLNQSDLVFINAVGCGYSQAIAPFNNLSFWGVDADAALFRDFIRRYLEVNNRMGSPKFLFGESYGGPRTAVLARQLQESGIPFDGLVLQSPAMDYNSNCGIGTGQGCGGYLPSYAAVGAFHRVTNPVPTDMAAWIVQARNYADLSYAPALQTYLSNGQNNPSLWQPLADLTGLPAAHWQANLGLGPTTYRQSLFQAQLLGRYDGRMKAFLGTPLAAEGDPSSTWIGSSFASGINIHLRDQLRYRNSSTFVLLSNAIDAWDFRHGGRALPDTIPDLGAVMSANTRLRVLAFNGFHDLATPFHLTETDLARLASPRIKVRNYDGGHMSYLDDATRIAQMNDMKAFYSDTLALRAAEAPQRQARAADPTSVVRVDRAGTPQRLAQPPAPEPAFQAPLRDPWVPPRR